jgi:hypothetical protein
MIYLTQEIKNTNRGGNKMTAILTKPLKKGIKTISGQLIQNGSTHITVCVMDDKGSKSIKRFKCSDYTIKIF